MPDTLVPEHALASSFSYLNFQQKKMQLIKSSLLDNGVTVQYDSIREAAQHLRRKILVKPVTNCQQRQNHNECRWKRKLLPPKVRRLCASGKTDARPT